MQNISKIDNILIPIIKQYEDFKNLLILQSLIKNWPEVFLFRIGIKNNILMKFKDGRRVIIKNLSDYHKFWDSKIGQLYLLQNKIDLKVNHSVVEFKWYSHTIYFIYKDDKQLRNIFGTIQENFITDQFAYLKVKNKDVVDIGANIADTAVYFVSKGAKHVYAFEPYPYSYNLAKKNIKLNKLENQITLLNEGCGGKNKKIKISSVFKNSAGSSLKNFKKGKTINITSLDQITKKLKLNNAILKIDCEGCEYGVILNAEKQSLRKFDQIAIEYHHGYLNLIKKLKDCGFKTKFTIPQCHSTITNKGYFGMIYAKRIIYSNQ